MTDFTAANRRLAALLETVGAPRVPAGPADLFCGLDVGTAFIVLAVVDAEGEPVACAYRPAEVVRDGMVVDYIGACDIARELKAELEEVLRVELERCAVAIPPGTESLDGGVVRNVAESAGFDVVAVFDEPSAANLLIGMADGAVVDIGGGTTGVSVLAKGEIVSVADEPTGGTHFTLVLAGAHSVTFEAAERMKRDAARHAEILPVVRPTIDKIGGIVHRACEGFDVREIVLVGGAAELAGIEGRLESVIGIPVVKPEHPMFVTPLGIALGCLEAVRGGAAPCKSA